MSNGIASGVPPADGGAGGAPGVGVGVGDCAEAEELISAITQVARAKDRIERIRSSQLKFWFALAFSSTKACRYPATPTVSEYSCG
jgi:hypothetical protein